MKFWASTAFMRSDELIDVARMLDDAGYHGVMVSDHVCYPRELKSPYPYSPHPDGRPIWEPETSWPDTWVLIGAMIGATKNLHFSNNIYIAGNRPLLVVAKQVGTAAVLSHNRVEFGLAAGWMREEFELNGQDWDNRGKRLNEMIRAARALEARLGRVARRLLRHPVDDARPGADRAHPHLLGRPHRRRAAKRAARYCDGWIGNAYPWEEGAHYIGKLRGYLRDYGRENDPFEIIVGFYARPSVDLYRRAAEQLGVTGTMCMPWAGAANVSVGDRDGLLETASVYRDSIVRFADEVVSKLQEG